METKDSPSPREKNDEGISWLTRPLYNSMLIALVLLFSFGKYFDGSVVNFLRACIWVPLGIIIIANVVNIFEFFKGFKKKDGNRS